MRQRQTLGAALVLLTVACGGRNSLGSLGGGGASGGGGSGGATVNGGASGSPGSAGATINSGTGSQSPPDVTRPTVVSVTPEESTTGVARTATVEVVFSEALAETSVTAQTVALSCDGKTVPTSVRYDATTFAVTLTPAGTLPVLGACMLTASTGVTDEAGNGLAGTVTSSFAVRDCVWGTASRIEEETGDASTPQVALNRNGNAIVVWTQFDGTYSSVYSNHYAAGTGWGTASLLEGSTGGAGSPQAAMDSSGNAVAVWYQYDGASLNIYSNRYMAGTGWGTPSPLDGSTGTTQPPQVAMDGSGNAVAVWHQHDGSYYSIYSNRYTAAMGWDTARLIEQDTGNATNPQVALDSSGNAVVVWSQHDGSYHSVYSNRYTAGVGWGTPSLLEENTGDASFPQVALDGSGNAVAVWRQSDGTYHSIYSNRYTAATGWGTPSLVEQNAGVTYDPQVAMDSSGNAVAVWYQSDGTAFSVYSNRYTTATGWGTPSLVEQNTGTAYAPQIALDSSGHALVVWYQSDGAHPSIYSNRYTAATGWSTPSLVEESTGEAYYPQVALDSSGNAVAVWQQYDSIYSNRCE